MIRVVIENILLFLLPAAMYLGYVLLTAQRQYLRRRRHQRCAAGVAVRRRRAAGRRNADLLRDRSRPAARRARPTRPRAWARTGTSSPAS